MGRASRGVERDTDVTLDSSGDASFTNCERAGVTGTDIERTGSTNRVDAACLYAILLVMIEVGIALFGGTTLSIWSAATVTLVTFFVALSAAWLLFPEMVQVIVRPLGIKSTGVLAPSVLK